jgi:hypothetical protein
MGFKMVSTIKIIIQFVFQGETGMATAMNTLFRTTDGVVGSTIASVPPAEYLSPLTIHTPRAAVPSPCLPNATAFTDIFLTAPGVSLAGDACDAIRYEPSGRDKGV